MSEPAPLLILGAGGHGRVVADAALRTQRWGEVRATARGLERSGELLPGVPLQAFEAALAQARAVHVAIGDAAARRLESEAAGLERLATVIHPEASVSVHAQVGDGCFVAARAVVGPLARLGRGVIVNHGAVVDHDNGVGDFSHVAPNATLGGSVQVGEGVLVGAGATVLPGLRVCAHAVIGAGAVVTQDISEPGVYAGVPARRIR
jgi:sugar O-acyltransferase (sialic acid O-acetyltransferase NeuD family)